MKGEAVEHAKGERKEVSTTSNAGDAAFVNIGLLAMYVEGIETSQSKKLLKSMKWSCFGIAVVSVVTTLVFWLV